LRQIMLSATARVLCPDPTWRGELFPAMTPKELSLLLHWLVYYLIFMPLS